MAGSSRGTPSSRRRTAECPPLPVIFPPAGTWATPEPAPPDGEAGFLLPTQSGTLCRVVGQHDRSLGVLRGPTCSGRAQILRRSMYRVQTLGRLLDLRRSSLDAHPSMYREPRYPPPFHLGRPRTWGSLHPSRGHRSSLRPALTARGLLPDPLGRPRLPLAASSPSPSQLGVDVATTGAAVAAVGVVRGVSTCLADVGFLFPAA